MVGQYYSSHEHTYERFNLTFSPSEQLSEAISPLYKPDMRDRAGKVAIRSVNYLDLEVIPPGRRYVYDRLGTGHNHIEQVVAYENQLERDFSKRRLAVVAFLKAAIDKNSGDIWLHLKAKTSPRDRFLLSALPEFAVDQEDPVVNLRWRITPEELVQDPKDFAIAHKEVVNVFGLRHPAARSLPAHKRVIDEDFVYVTGAKLKSSKSFRV